MTELTRDEETHLFLTIAESQLRLWLRENTKDEVALHCRMHDNRDAVSAFAGAVLAWNDCRRELAQIERTAKANEANEAKAGQPSLPESFTDIPEGYTVTEGPTLISPAHLATGEIIKEGD